MSRTLSAAARAGINAQETDAAWLYLVTISHPGMAAPIRVVNDIRPEDANQVRKLVSQGREFVCYPFEITLPDDDPEREPQIQLRIDNIDRAIVTALRKIGAGLTVTLEAVRHADPDTIEFGPLDMAMDTAEYDALVVVGELKFPDTLNRAYPAGTFIPSTHPGLF